MILFPFQSGHSYDFLRDKANDGTSDLAQEPSELPKLKLRSKVFTLLVLCLVVAVLVTAAIIGTLVSHQHPNESRYSSKSDAKPHLCGNSSDEAIAAGCTFNQLLWAWIPPECPSYANDDFLAAGDWTYYIDPLGKQQVTEDSWSAAMNNEITLWGEKGEHLSHCVFMFLSLGRIIHEGTAYPPRLVSNEHLQHCAKYLLEELKRGQGWRAMENSVGRVSYDEYCFKF